MSASLDGERVGEIIYSPYTLTLNNVPAGDHTLGLTLYGNRANGFGCVHNADLDCLWIGPNSWRTTGNKWCYEYNLHPLGILKSPELYF